MEPVYHPYINENFSSLLPKAQSDLKWKETAYKVSEWSLWLLAGVSILGIVVTSAVFPHIISPELALSIAPALTLVFALNETRLLWSSNIVAPRYRAFIEAKNRVQELKSLVEEEKTLTPLSHLELRQKVATLGLDLNRAHIDRALIARYQVYAKQAETSQVLANQLFIDPANEVNYYKGYREEEVNALANKVHAAAMLHLMMHPTDLRPLKELAPITPQRFDDRARTSGVAFGGNYLPNISRRDIRFGTIREIARQAFGT